MSKGTSKAQGRANSRKRKPGADNPKAARTGRKIPSALARIFAKAKAEREALDRRTNGQYSALCELERALGAVLEVQAGQRTFAIEDDATALELDLLGRSQRVDDARQALLRTGFTVRKNEWLSCAVDFDVGRSCVRRSTVKTGEAFLDVKLPGRPGLWRVWWDAVPDPAALDRCIRQVRAAIMRLGIAPADTKTGGGRADRGLVPWDDDDPNFSSLSAIVEWTSGRLTMPSLSRLLTDHGPIDFMRRKGGRGAKCKAHLGQLVEYLEAQKTDVEAKAVAELIRNAHGAGMQDLWRCPKCGGTYNDRPGQTNLCPDCNIELDPAPKRLPRLSV